MRLEARDLSFHYKPSSPVLKRVSFSAGEGELVVIIGSNGAGKSTLMKCLARVEKTRDAVFLEGREINSISGEELKDSLGYLPQDNMEKVFLTVFETVLLGRIRNSSWKVGDKDLQAVWDTLDQLKISDLSGRYLHELSGGQRQIVSLAQSLIRSPQILLLDEPSNNLDMHNELKVLEMIWSVTRSREMTTLMTIHSLSMAARFADRIILLKEGELLVQGTPEEVLTPEMIGEAFRVEAELIRRNGEFHVIPGRAL